eukprot:TRINITY_DN26679_c0_g1_i1.p1 TRINITY_DN26679_c0_g1~~TRINITY_DN26679_c0_g1_i1.p1  ORF type:complete len:711 (-),score=252.76 TRINITY_DN26679_c0_g1_i1:344-2476(-)
MTDEVAGSSPAAAAAVFEDPYKNATDGTRVISDDRYLEPWAHQLRERYARYVRKKAEIVAAEGSLVEFSRGFKRFGLNRVESPAPGIMYREWAPSAKALFLYGEFNNWNRTQYPASKDQFGVWSLFLPDVDGVPVVHHRSRIRIIIIGPNGEELDRIPAWVKVAWQNDAGQPFYDGVYWEPKEKYQWKHTTPEVPSDLRIYEAHVGMSSTEPKISTYIEFTRDVLPWIKELGYNAIQLMAIQEHAYYASFGYQVTNFFAISSRFGTPEELKALIDTAHSMGILVILDLVHSHTSKNTKDGLNMFDGTDHCYFHEGGKGYHWLWDSRLFNYSHWEVLRFLMSNACWFIEEYNFDGFRFDGVTSMLYQHHGMAHAFVNGYDEYFNSNLVDPDAVMYLTLVNDMLHSLRPRPHSVITIAEDVSGMATLCRPSPEGGIGFDYRLAMGIPDMWIETLKTVKDEDWNMGHIVHSLTNRRYLEPTVAYAESHDQSLVGDKTIAFWLMDKEMYDNMSVQVPQSAITARGIALHKMIRLITCALGGEAYLNFMGNEFGHPEWIDFPREGNNGSYHYARRRFDLPKEGHLRYKFMSNFDRGMHALEQRYKWLSSPPAYVYLKHEGDKLITFHRGAIDGGLFFIFNFHHEKSFDSYRFGVPANGKYRIVLNSDEPEAYGGFGRVAPDTVYFAQPTAWDGCPQSIQVYIPSRTVLVLALAGE